MDNEEFHATPKPQIKRRRLGLANSTPGIRYKQPLTPTEHNNNNNDQTPRTLSIAAVPLANTTNCRIGLRRRHPKHLTKKKLELSFEPESKDDLIVKDAAATPIEDPTQLKLFESRQEKISKLEVDIEIWRNGFRAAVEDMQALTTPRPRKEDILAQLGIPLEMLKYLDDD